MITINVVEIYKKIAEDINLFIDQKLKHIKCDRTFKARITEKISDGKYTIIYQNRYYTVKCSAELFPGDTIYVCAPDNNWSELFINLPCSRAEFETVRNECTVLNSDLVAINSEVSAYRRCLYTGSGVAQNYVIQKNSNLPRMVFTARGFNGSQTFSLLIPIALTEITSSLVEITPIVMGTFPGKVYVTNTNDTMFRIKIDGLTAATCIVLESYPWPIVSTTT